MKTILSEIKHLRGSETLNIDYTNNNRYRVIINENDGGKTAYCFSTPIYNNHSRKAVSLNFREVGSAFYGEGSNAKITITDEIRLENGEGSFKLKLESVPQLVSEHELLCDQDRIFRTLNGVLYKANLKGKSEVSFEVEVGSPHLKVRTNEKYFALMRAKFRPFVSISCLGAVYNDSLAPAKITYEKISGRKYRVIIAPHCPPAEYALFEVNLYEPKLIQDTTVENLNPKKNNAFGSVAFLGETDPFGEQWLYWRPEFTNIIDLMNKNVDSVLFHFPLLNKGTLLISAYKAVRRFCSFGSKWNNKVPIAEFMGDLNGTDNYLHLDATKWLVKPWANRLMATAGFILKPKVKEKNHSVIATGDSYCFPIIMEIKYRD